MIRIFKLLFPVALSAIVLGQMTTPQANARGNDKAQVAKARSQRGGTARGGGFSGGYHGGKGTGARGFAIRQGGSTGGPSFSSRSKGAPIVRGSRSQMFRNTAGNMNTTGFRSQSRFGQSAGSKTAGLTRTNGTSLSRANRNLALRNTTGGVNAAGLRSQSRFGQAAGANATALNRSNALSVRGNGAGPNAALATARSGPAWAARFRKRRLQTASLDFARETSNPDGARADPTLGTTVTGDASTVSGPW